MGVELPPSEDPKPNPLPAWPAEPTRDPKLIEWLTLFDVCGRGDVRQQLIDDFDRIWPASQPTGYPN